MQTRVPDTEADWIEDEAARRGMDCPEFFRQVIVAGVSVLRGDE